jgi:hypothetical protein
VLQFEYNTPEKAHELVQYYTERPGLQEYTIQKELARMDYTAVTGHQPQVVTTSNKTEIAKLLQADHTLLSRCANQSLLADLLQVFTGPDMIVRPQYLATVIATTCRFRLDPAASTVRAEAAFELLLPTERGKWKIADVEAQVTFCFSTSSQQQQPFVEYSVTSIRPDDSLWNEYFDSAVELLSSLHPGEEEEEEEGMDQNFRDVFLAQSQNALQNSAVGLKSALEEIDSVVGISKKLKQIPSFLPKDVIQAAEQCAHSPPKVRPQSILGGLMRTGFSKLAKSVTLPDEDPSLYQDWNRDGREPAAPQFYQRTQVPHDTRNIIPAPPPPKVVTPVVRHPNPPARPGPSAPAIHKEDGKAPTALRGSRPKSTTPPSERHQLAAPVVVATRINQEVGISLPKKSTLPAASQQPLEVANSWTSSSNAKEEGGMDDGWGDNDDDADLEEETASDPPSDHGCVPPPQETTLKLYKAEVVPDWDYNPQDDIIPTRKRWVNPRSGMRELRQISSR